MKLRLFLFLLFLCLSFVPAHAEEGRLRQLLEKRMQAKGDGEALDELTGWGGKGCIEKAALVEKMKRFSKKNFDHVPKPSLTVSYGEHKAQAMDVYLPKEGTGNSPYPVILMVHGGGWCIGDKWMDQVVTNKVNRWVPKGFIFVSANYRMIPDGVYPAGQAEDVASALTYVQQHAGDWQGDGGRVIAMGHSAGAHLFSLIAADISLAAKQGTKPWLGTVSLDSGSMDVPEHMKSKHFGLYDEAFGKDEAGWIKVSPLHHLAAGTLPWMGVCSAKRKDACPQAKAYAEKLKSLKVDATVLELDLSHKQVNANLGQPGAYTEAVEEFMGSLDEEVKKRLE